MNLSFLRCLWINPHLRTTCWGKYIWGKHIPYEKKVMIWREWLTLWGQQKQNTLEYAYRSWWLCLVSRYTQRVENDGKFYTAFWSQFDDRSWHLVISYQIKIPWGPLQVSMYSIDIFTPQFWSNDLIRCNRDHRALDPEVLTWTHPGYALI